MYVARSSPRHAGHGALRNHLRARILDCRTFRREAATVEEQEGWLAEEAGLIDALLGRDRSALPRHDGPASQRDRYILGLHDGRTLVMADDDALYGVGEDGVSEAGEGMEASRPEPELEPWTRANNFSTPPGKESERYA